MNSSSHCTIIVLLSGRGSNFKNLIEHREAFSVSAVISDNAAAGGLEYGKVAGIPTFSFERKNFETLRKQKEALYHQIRQIGADYIVLAGYMQIVAPEFVEEFKGRIINIHPSLLPLLPGLHSHERALLEGHKFHGCTVHVVDAGVDTGNIIAQAKVGVLPEDNAESLAARVLAREHKLYPWVINGIGSGDIVISKQDSSITVSEKLRQSASENEFIIPAA